MTARRTPPTVHLFPLYAPFARYEPDISVHLYVHLYARRTVHPPFIGGVRLYGSTSKSKKRTNTRRQQGGPRRPSPERRPAADTPTI